jgi:cell division GTPase FtsZ
VQVALIGVGQDGGELAVAPAAHDLAREADATLLVDNDAWRESGEPVDEGFEAINGRTAQRVGLLLAAREDEAGDVAAESVIDSSEVITTLWAGRLAAIGYASATGATNSTTSSKPARRRRTRRGPSRCPSVP